MSSENGWIPWNDRTDLENVFLFVTTELEGAVSDEYLETVGILGISEGVSCYSKTSVIFHLGKIPDKYLLDNIGEIAWGEFSLDCRSQVRLEVLKESDISKVQKRVAENYRSYCKKNGFNNDWCYKKILEIVRDYESSDRESFYCKKNNLSDKSAAAPFVSDSPAVPASAPNVDVPAVISDDSSFVLSVASRERVTSKTVEVKPAPDMLTEILRELKAFRKEQRQQGEQQTEILQQSLEVQQQNIHHRKIESLDNIPLLNLESGDWLIASEYAKTRKPPISVDTLKQGRSNVKKKKEGAKGEVAADNSKGIHGKHVWRFGGFDKNGNEIYYYYIHGVDGKYTP